MMMKVRVIMGRDVRLGGRLHQIGDVVDVPVSCGSLAGALRLGFVELVEETPEAPEAPEAPDDAEAPEAPTKPTRSALWREIKDRGLDDGVDFRRSSRDELAAILGGWS
jgi:hypothetical protein